MSDPKSTDGPDGAAADDSLPSSNGAPSNETAPAVDFGLDREEAAPEEPERADLSEPTNASGADTTAGLAPGGYAPPATDRVEPAPETGHYPSPYTGAAAPEAKGLAITALVLGIVAFVGIWLPFIIFIALPASVVGVILGIVALVKRQPKGLALTGLILSAVALLVGGVLLIVGLIAAAAFLETYDMSEIEGAAAMAQLLVSA